MRHRTRHETVARFGRTAGSVVATACCALAPSTALAAGPTAYDSYAWVWATVVSVLIIAAVWLASGTFMRAAIRLRWIPKHHKIVLDRSINVFFGALLLVALVVPYLAVTAPAMAMSIVGVFIAASLAAFMLRRPHSDDDIRLQE